MSEELPVITINDQTNCTQLVANLVFDHFELKKQNRNNKLLTGTGQGYGEGSICGALAGGIFAINTLLDRQGASETEIIDAQSVFKQKFHEQFSAYNCSDILDTHFKNSESKYETRQPRFCGSLISESVDEIVEIVNLVIASINPVMMRYANL